MPVSEKQLRANRANAQKSTGPKTPFGKFRSSRNALKHGRYSHFALDRTLSFFPPKMRHQLLKKVVRAAFRDIGMALSGK